MSAHDPLSQFHERDNNDYEPYVISDERLAEIRAMFTDRDAWDTYVVTATPGTTKAMLLGAIVDLLADRDERRVA